MTDIDRPVETALTSGQDRMASLIHDLGNYIQIAISAVSIMSRHADVLASEGLGTMVLHAADSLERAGALVRRTSGEGPAEGDEDIDLDACLNQLRPMLGYVCGPTIAVRLLLSTVPKIRCSQLAFQNALLNLALNARDAMPKGGSLTISAMVADGPQAPEVEVAVTDTGTGMTRAILDRAFEPHFSTKPAGAGHGMGLPGVRLFAQRSGGRSSIISMQGVGTSVILRLPMSSSPAGEAP